MDYKELVARLGEKEVHVRYWRTLLIKEDLIHPRRGKGRKFLFSDEDFEQFKKLQKILNDGASTVPEAIRLMKRGLTPGEALDHYERSQRMIEQLQKKVLALRQPWWKRFWRWLTRRR